KESQIRDEQPIISGVFDKRLRKGMYFQNDPTVIYGLGEQFNGNLTRKHLRTDTPYNTYTRWGLPPTPICLPGEGALMAAAMPAETTAYYFVAKGGGRHKFSDTLEEHNAAVRKYQLRRK
ncbi:MAG: endolytic transglycosylase MltG, partial [Gammaproteobacteria bacterium]|nr:endolytic transglycosylase MltG [Gammaproteobacteria bacterium]